MITITPERRSTGPLIATIDLLFLMVAFFVLLLFFLQRQQSTTQVELEQTQERLESVQAEKSTLDRVLEEVRPYIGDVTAMRQAAEERRRAEQARELRKREKETLRLDYEILPGSLVLYKGNSYPVERFTAEVVKPLRERHWIAFRALARPDTPFGQVVNARRVVLEQQQEFDTYWDNLAPNRPNP